MNKPYFIKGITNDPYFNIASEEYLLKHTDGFYVYLWVNAPAVIVGVNQNTAEEVNLAYTEGNGINVVRRQTGGGAIYHDLNNVCYTIIAEYDGSRDNYRYFTQGIISYLATLGVRAEFSGRNDLTIDGKKFSGNAQCIYKNRVMHHGTLLFKTDPAVLENALKPNKLKIESKGIKSVRARVTNIFDHLNNKLTVDEFFEGLAGYFSADCLPYTFTKDDITQIEKLKEEKYSTFEWNIGSSPKATYTAEKKLACGVVKAGFDVVDGRLKNVNISGDFFSKKEISALYHALNGVLYQFDSLKYALADVGDYIVGSTADEIASLFING